MKLLNAAIAIVVSCALVFGCTHTNDVTPLPPVVTDQSDCPAACENLRSLNCEEGNPIDLHKPCLIDVDCAQGQFCSPLPKDKSRGTCVAPCETFCTDTENAGVWLDPGCVSHIGSCREIESCPVPQPKPKQ